MNGLVRFGRKIPLPSTVEIKHEMRLMAAADALMNTVSPDEAARIVTELAARQGFSTSKAQNLVNRFASERHALAQDAVRH